jgi:hypothetical protein
MVMSSTDIVSARGRVDCDVDRELRSQPKLGIFNGLMAELGTHPFRDFLPPRSFAVIRHPALVWRASRR